jgi:hypothetical protein
MCTDSRPGAEPNEVQQQCDGPLVSTDESACDACAEDPPIPDVADVDESDTLRDGADQGVPIALESDDADESDTLRDGAVQGVPLALESEDADESDTLGDVAVQGVPLAFKSETVDESDALRDVAAPVTLGRAVHADESGAVHADESKSADVDVTIDAVVLEVEPTADTDEPKEILRRRERARQVIDSTKFQVGFALWILAGGVLFAAEVSLDHPEREDLTSIWYILENVLLLGFLLELSVRIYVERGEFCNSGWNIFDSFLVLIAGLNTWVLLVMEATNGDADRIQGGQLAPVLRLLRFLRFTRYIRMARGFWRVFRVGRRTTFARLEKTAEKKRPRLEAKNGREVV